MKSSDPGVSLAWTRNLPYGGPEFGQGCCTLLMTFTDPTLQKSIRENIYHAAHWAIGDWDAYKWHRTNGQPDTHVSHSSQALCISVWGTFASAEGKAVRRVITGLLNDGELQRAIGRYDTQIPLTLESDSRELLNEYGGTQSHLDGVLDLDELPVVIESKLTEPLGCCSQVKQRHCSGIYGPGSDLKLKRPDPCRLLYKDQNRTSRLYWDIMGQLSRPDSYPFGQACPFAGSGFQVMRNIAAAFRMATGKNTGGNNGREWRVIFAYPSDPRTSQAIRAVREKLNPEQQKRVLSLDYLQLAELLGKSSDPIAKGLSQHMSARLGINVQNSS